MLWKGNWNRKLKIISAERYTDGEYTDLKVRQVVRVMLNMGYDLGFFGIVWGVLILAFSTAMLGARAKDPRRESNETMIGGEGESLPMHSWSTWWFLNTYFQSLGQVMYEYWALTVLIAYFGLDCNWDWDWGRKAQTHFWIQLTETLQDNLDKMTSHSSNIIFLFMWPIFNVLLVNCFIINKKFFWFHCETQFMKSTENASVIELHCKYSCDCTQTSVYRWISLLL